MICKKYVLGLMAVLLTSVVFAQKDPVVMKVNGKPVTKTEFEHIFKKNNKDEDITKDDIDEYLELFTNFKLKVTAAEELGMDTVEKFRKELAQYREQLAQPYLVDQSMNEMLMKEAYDHMQYEVKASHILIKVEINADPADSLKAYTTILEAKKKIESGEDFAKVAKQYSEDPSAKQNSGSLGYFTAFKMVYPFEKAAFETEPGKLSQIIRTRFGYHLLKVYDKRAARGTRLAAHILIRASGEDTKSTEHETEKKAREIYNKLKEGTDFEQLAKQFSEDRNSAAVGGKLKWFGAGDLIPAFDDALFGLKNDGDYSAPVKTRFGWHIIQLLGVKKIGTYDEVKGEIKSKIAKDARNAQTKASFIKKLKKEYKFKMKKKALEAFANRADSTILLGKYRYTAEAGDTKWLFQFNKKKYSIADFGKYLEDGQQRAKLTDPASALKNRFNQWVSKTLISYEKTQLESKYLKYKMLMKEYRDGILLFELTDQKVWGKAVKDTSGLKAYYNEHQKDFVWKERAVGDFYFCIGQKSADHVSNLLNLGDDKETIAKQVNEDSPLNVNVRTRTEEIESLDYTNELKVGINGPFEYNGQKVMVFVKEIIAPGPKKLKEAKGIITAAYQDHLEKEWITELKAKYSVEVNKDVLYTIH
ncbi:MAG: peptidylprolyl isomerase [Flavobacteriales bacterium]|nr:peptidylprolyl isomerase [Flavobacteriales bacterium]